MRSGNERVGRHDHLAVQLERPGNDFQRDRALARRNAVSGSQGLRHALLKLMDHPAVVGEPAAVNDLANAAKQHFAVADVWPAHVQRFAESGRTTQNREVI